MKKLLLAVGLLLCFAERGWAACPNPLTVKDAAGTTQNISTTNDGSGNCQSAIVINVGSALDGWNLTEGTKADSAYAGSGSASLIAIGKGNYTGIQGVISAINAPIPAGTNIIGKVDIDQTTPGTTNAVTTTPQTPTVTDAATSLVLKASATATIGLVWAHAENYSSTNGFLVVYNATTAPSTGALTASLILACQRLPGSGYADIQRNPGLSASTGVVLLVTSASTCATYTTGTITANLTGSAS